jgi:protein-tyrosine phosphatase
MAEGFFLYQLKKNNSFKDVNSAGLNALVNYPADKNACGIMKQDGIDISQHKAKQLTFDLVKKTDLILVMTKSHLRDVTQQFQIAKEKIFLLGHWQGLEIQDPYAQSFEAFKKVYQQIKMAWQEWKTRIL